MIKNSMLATILFSVATTSSIANTPASTLYVDQRIAATKAELVTLINSNSNSVTHPIGSCYGGGIVFYVNTTPGAQAGQHGLIVALNDVPASGGGLIWDATGGAVVPGTSSQYFTGEANTNAIINTLNSGKAPAAEAAYNYTTSENCSTCTEWYLPSEEELITMLTQSDSSGASFWTKCGGGAPAPSASTYYWSSTQFNQTKTWAINFDPTDYGHAEGITSSNMLQVRATRAF